ncbi:putative Oxalate decarboxylase oxdD [Glarea lozoyensis 74030]|uniref:Putative Oxalate decarboxylase oxdD n=1 Tax=Glarea lozoyensis (strain ATCC 74030 / MF5533) TaxID=1104152 RepID=H0EJH3_GLAL7|nr:putative Oxalate decarboxylase oxdD [Glarea lozoyensis 74030]
MTCPREKRGAGTATHRWRQRRRDTRTNEIIEIAAVSNEGKNQVFRADKGDIWYFPKGQGHTIQGLTDPGAEYLLVFDAGDFDSTSRTLNVADWLIHTPPSVLAKNFGVSNNTFKTLPKALGSIFRGNLIWLGGGNARTFDFEAGDTAVFPDNSGHYVENTHPTETLRYLEIFQSDKVVDFGLEQWLALTPPDLVAQILNVSVETVKSFKSERGILVKGKE